MIFTVIPVHNRKEFTRNCLGSLRNQTNRNFKVLVIDDGSTDGTAEMLANKFPEVHVINGDGNLWWTRAVNLGVNYALHQGTTAVLTLNNDTIAPEDFIRKMVYWADKFPTALLGAFAIDATSLKPVYGGEVLDWKLAASRSLLDTLPKEEWHGLHDVTHLPGRGLYIPAEVFGRIGLFDERHLPHYLADYDFTHRARRAGYKVFCNYDAILRVYPAVSGDAENKARKSFPKYYRHLFGITGGGNLRDFCFYAIANCPPKFLPLFLPIGLGRRIAGYLRDWLLELFGKRP